VWRVVRPLFLAEEDVLELHHPGIHEQQRRFVAGTSELEGTITCPFHRSTQEARANFVRTSSADSTAVPQTAGGHSDNANVLTAETLEAHLRQGASTPGRISKWREITVRACFQHLPDSGVRHGHLCSHPAIAVWLWGLMFWHPRNLRSATITGQRPINRLLPTGPSLINTLLRECGSSAHCCLAACLYLYKGFSVQENFA